MKLNQVIALVNGKKTRTKKALTGIYQQLAKSDAFAGLDRSYQPLDDEGETRPPEQKVVQLKVSDILKKVEELMSEAFDIVYTQDIANTVACADIVVDEVVVVKDVPVTHLLYLEKQLDDIHTFIGHLPVLSLDTKWEFDGNKDVYVSSPTKTNATKKILRNHVKAEATDKHPAQVEVYTEDVKVGEWTTVKFSGAMPIKEKNELLARVVKLQEAVKKAREAANGADVGSFNIGDKLFNYILGE